MDSWILFMSTTFAVLALAGSKDQFMRLILHLVQGRGWFYLSLSLNLRDVGNCWRSLELTWGRTAYLFQTRPLQSVQSLIFNSCQIICYQSIIITKYSQLSKSFSTRVVFAHHSDQLVPLVHSLLAPVHQTTRADSLWIPGLTFLRPLSDLNLIPLTERELLLELGYILLDYLYGLPYCLACILFALVLVSLPFFLSLVLLDCSLLFLEGLEFGLERLVALLYLHVLQLPVERKVIGRDIELFQTIDQLFVLKDCLLLLPFDGRYDVGVGLFEFGGNRQSLNVIINVLIASQLRHQILKRKYLRDLRYLLLALLYLHVLSYVVALYRNRLVNRTLFHYELLEACIFK